MLNIKDKPGCISAEEMRTHFERTIKSTPAIKSNTPLGGATVNGKFSHYMDPDTDTMWLGFALGMRMAERLNKAERTEGGGTP
jgi:hypothetical protein